MDSRIIRLASVFVAMLVLAFLSACGGGGGSSSSSSPATSTSLGGKVVDAYVSGATVKVYSDQAMTTQIGSGTTDGNGEFSITLNVSSIPSTVYIKTEGGIDTETGLPAPTMVFVGSASGGTINVTPLTEKVFAYMIAKGLDLNTASSVIAGKLGINTDEVGGDPELNQDVKGALNKILASGTSAGSLPDGNYSVKLLFYLKDDLTTSLTSTNDIANKVRSFSLAIQNGNISGTVDIDGDSQNDLVQGRVQGSVILMNVTSATGDLYRLAGDIALGAASGMINKLSSSGSVPSNGIFLADFTPANITAQQITGLYDVMGQILYGSYYFAAREVLLDTGLAAEASPAIIYGTIDFSNDLDQTGVSYSNFSVHRPLNPASGGGEIDISLGSGSATFIANSRIAVIKEDTGSDDLYSVFIPGNRRGLFLNAYSGQLGAAGEVVVAGVNDITPCFESGKTYYSNVAIALVMVLNQNRQDILSMVNFTDPNPKQPVFSGTIKSGYIQPSGTHEHLVIAGSSMIVKSDQDDDFSTFNGAASQGQQGDSVMSLDMYEGGAMAGVRVEGGNIDIDGPSGPMPSINFPDFPITCVIYNREDGTTPPSFTGTLNFLARELYSNDYTSYQNAYIYGTLTIGATSGSLSGYDAQGNALSAALTVEKVTDSGTFTGMYHLYGPAGSDYIDIYWPVGGGKATYMVSTAANGTVEGVGEAYLTF